MERARCYALLGQQKTAIFDFSAILKDHPKHVQALCGRSFTYLMLNQQQVMRGKLFAIEGIWLHLLVRVQIAGYK